MNSSELKLQSDSLSHGYVNTCHILQIDFPSLVNVRIVKRSDSIQSEGTVLPAANGTFVPSEMSKGASQTDNQQLQTPATPGMLRPEINCFKFNSSIVIYFGDLVILLKH